MKNPIDPESTESEEPVGDDYSEPEFVAPEPTYASYDPTQRVPDPSPIGPFTDEEGKELPEFDERYKEAFHGLAFIGSLSSTFDFLGHEIVIHTLVTDDALHIAALTKEFGGTIGDGLAYRVATAAMCVDSIDGQSLPQPLGGVSNYAFAQSRFAYARANWFQHTVDAIYTKYLELELEVRQVVEAMGKAYGQRA